MTTSAVLCFFFLPYFVGFQLHRKDNKPIKPDNPKTTQSNQAAKQKSGIWVVGCLVIYCPKKMTVVRNLSNYSGSIVYLHLYSSIVKFRAVFSQLNWWVADIQNYNFGAFLFFSDKSSSLTSTLPPTVQSIPSSSHLIDLAAAKQYWLSVKYSNSVLSSRVTNPWA